jgi:hypothetical protein
MTFSRSFGLRSQRSQKLVRINHVHTRGVFERLEPRELASDACHATFVKNDSTCGPLFQQLGDRHLKLKHQSIISA